MDKQKQIEEMAKVIFERGVALESIDFIAGTKGSDHFERIATALYNAGYRKSPENAVARKALDKIRNGHEPLQKLIQDLREENEFLKMERTAVFFDGVKEGVNKLLEMALIEYAAFDDSDKLSLGELRENICKMAKEITKQR